MLFGPFIGSLFWEFYRFAPYSIYLKKKNPKWNLIVYTRPQRFDLYGEYADIFVPLRTRERMRNLKQNCFSLDNFLLEEYQELISVFKEKYSSRYHVKAHFFPRIDNYRHLVKWQFPRNKMDYDFKEREANLLFLEDKFDLNKNIVFFDSTYVFSKNIKLNYINDIISDKNIELILYDKFSKSLKNNLNNYSFDNLNYSILGCIISIIKKSFIVISDLKSDIARLSLLLKTPVLVFKKSISDDELKLINPFNTEVVLLKNLEELDNLL